MVLNDGTGTVKFLWNIDYATMFNQNYVLEVVPPPPASAFTIGSFPGASSPIANYAVWNVPAGAPAGCYYGRLTFYSDWCFGNPNKPEAQASVGFVVSPASRVRLCKFFDANNNGIRDSNEPVLPGWQFTVTRVDTGQKWDLVTGPLGCTEEIAVPVLATGTTRFTIYEHLQPGWVKTTPMGNTNPVNIDLSSGDQWGSDPCQWFGNWQPITISGYKYLDDAPQPWTTPPTNPTPWPAHYPPVLLELYRVQSGVAVLLDSTTTDPSGYFKFPSKDSGVQHIQWEPNLVIWERPISAVSPPLLYTGNPTVCSGHDLAPWPGVIMPSASNSPWRQPSLDLGSKRDIIDLTNLPQPTTAYQNYSNNEFYNCHPSRIWGFMCPNSINLGCTTITVTKGSKTWSSDSCCLACGLYCVAAPSADDLRPGLYVLTPPPLPAGREWVVTIHTWNGNIVQSTPTSIGPNGSYAVDVPPGADIRVDFCVKVTDDGNRRCNLPVTFTQEGWKAFSDPGNTIVSGGMIYNRFPMAFQEFSFYGTGYKNKIAIGKGSKIVTFEGTAGGMNRMVLFLPQTGKPGKLDRTYENPWDKTSAGVLAGETLALQMNIGYNNRRLMPRSPGFDLEKFKLASGFFKGKTVGQVLDIANAILGGTPPSGYGLPKDPNDPTDTGYNSLVEILRAINANYEFIDFSTYLDRGYLIPDKPLLGTPNYWYYPSVPYVN